MHLANLAYDTLSNDKKRREYDRRLSREKKLCSIYATQKAFSSRAQTKSNAFASQYIYTLFSKVHRQRIVCLRRLLILSGICAIVLLAVVYHTPRSSAPLPPSQPLGSGLDITPYSDSAPGRFSPAPFSTNLHNGSYTKAIPNPSSGAVYVRPATAPNGQPWPKKASYLKGYSSLHKNGLSRIRVDNTQSSSDVFVKLVFIESASFLIVRQFYIPANDAFTVEHVRAGTYDIRYQDLSTGSIRRSEPFVLQEKRFATRAFYSDISITLYKIVNGNMDMYKISDAEFN